MISEIEKSSCTGCKMCADVCPHNAITYKSNEEGYWYPICSSSACTKCGLCVKVCPVKEGAGAYYSERTGYVAWSNNDDIRRKSTSGGLYYEFATKVLNDGGYIIGSVYSEDFCSAYHIATKDPDDLQRIMGSKYFQSDTGGIYKRTEELVKKGVSVLFTGTPCQIAALDAYLGKNYDNLIMVDFLCRGVPSPELQKKKIELYESKANAKVIYYSDKTKPYGWSNFGETIKFDNGKKRFISRWKDDINDCFIEKNLNLRESCYKCHFKDGNRAADITIGDFWGIKGVTEKDLLYGVSCMITNTKKGEQFVTGLGGQIYKGRRPLCEVSEYNRAYIDSAERPAARDTFFSQVFNKGIKNAVGKYTKKSFKKLAYRELHVLKTKFKATCPSLRYFKHINILKFIKYNYFCPQINRRKGCYVFPYRGAYLSIAKSAKVDLTGNFLVNYYPCYERGAQMSRVKIGENAKLYVRNRVELAYGTTFSINNGGELSLGYFYTGVGVNIICDHKIHIGNNVMLGRDVCLFDSDYHTIMDSEGVVVNEPKEVIIEDNCWVGARSMILKGSHIQQGAIISANSMVMGIVESNRVYINKREAKSVGGNIIWER